MDTDHVMSSPARTQTNTTVPIRIHKSTAKDLKALVTKCNKKALGRKVRADDVVKFALGLIGKEDIERIKESTYSSQDQLEIEFKKYCAANGSISKDEFLKILLSGIVQKEKTYE